MSRFSMRGMPSNWWVIMLGAMGLFFVHDSWNDAQMNARFPRPMSVAAFSNQADAQIKHLFVSVQGKLVPSTRFSLAGKDASRDFVALLDPHVARGIWVEVKPGQYTGTQPFTARISGVMWGVDSDAQSQIAAHGARVGGVPMQTAALLSAGQSAPLPFWVLFWMGVSALALASFGGMSLARNIVFWPQSAPKVAPLSLPDDQPLPVRVSGKLRLHAKATGRFLNVPTRTVRLGDGTFALASNIDASQKVGGTTTQSRAGVWLLVPASGWTTRTGVLAHGTRRYPAVKISYRDSLDKGRRASAVIACENEAIRAALLIRLEREAARASPMSAFQTL